MRRHTVELTLCALVAGSTCLAQVPRWTAQVPDVQEGGLHAITLSPELLGCSRTDFGDIRLLDDKGGDVPYVLREVLIPGASGTFLPYAMLRNEVLSHSTVIELERPSDEMIDVLHLWIKPMNAEKRVRITGSEDRGNWYMVQDEHLVAQGAHGDPPHQVLVIDVPRNDHRYLRLTMNDSLTAPMQVLGVGRFADGRATIPSYLDAGNISFTQHDSAGRSFAKVERAVPVLAERMVYAVSDTTDFRREAWIETWDHGTKRKGRRDLPTRTTVEVTRTVLASDMARIIDPHGTRLDTFRIVIENGDDRPLHFSSLRIMARHRVMLANLTPGAHYHITTGDAALGPPQYDMGHFADKLPVPVDTFAHAALMAIPGPTSGAVAFDPSNWWVWAAIIALMLGMGWAALRMLRKH